MLEFRAVLNDELSTRASVTMNLRRLGFICAIACNTATPSLLAATDSMARAVLVVSPLAFDPPRRRTQSVRPADREQCLLLRRLPEGGRSDRGFAKCRHHTRSRWRHRIHPLSKGPHRVLQRAELLRSYKLKETSVTNRVVATCCNSAVFVNFDRGPHWVSAYRARFHGELPPLQLRICTKFKPDSDVLPDDVPSYRRYPRTRR